MYCRIIAIILVALAVILGLSSRALAFTLHHGPIADADVTVPGSEASDLPTPQLFRVRVSRDGMTLGVVHPSEASGPAEADIYFREVSLPQPISAPARQADSRPATTHRLRGVELLLLRDTEVIAGRQSE